MSAFSVYKFGGSSVANAERIGRVIDILLPVFQKEGKKLTVVFSAFGGVTDTLIALSKMAVQGDSAYLELLHVLEQRHFLVIDLLISKDRGDHVAANIYRVLDELRSLLHGVSLVKELTARTLDYVMSFGERLSAYIITQAIKERFLDVDFLDARKLLLTDDHFGGARVDFERSYAAIQEYYQQHSQAQIVTGFIAATVHHETTTLGRGGSDYTASLFAAALDAKELQIWTDVDGVMTADPRKVEQAFPLKSMTYHEAMEISHFGAKVIHPPTMHPALAKKIPIVIKNSFNPEAPGTVIQEDDKTDSQGLIKGISSIDSIALLRVQGSGIIGIVGVSSRLFAALGKRDVNVILITQASSEHSICVAVDVKVASIAKQAIEEEFSLEIYAGQVERVVVEDNLSIVAIVGENMKRRTGVSEHLFRALGRNGINVIAIAQGSSELNISVVIDKKDEIKALNAIHDAFFLSEKVTVSLFLVGLGLIGSTLIEQIKERAPSLLKEDGIDLRLLGVGNTRNMLFDSNGLNFSEMSKQLQDSKLPMDMYAFVGKMKEFNRPNSIFVDCTAAEMLIPHYWEILKGSISIVTPNKKANSTDYSTYCKLRALAKKQGVSYCYETNVGAGLPVISTLNNLIRSGDKIIKIEAVISGTLSYLFSTYNGEISFSSLVRDAREKGYTEPDPREDLSGQDVARKLLILVRESGYPMEPEDVFVEGLLSDECLQVKEGVDAFFALLEQMDKEFKLRYTEAKKQGKALRYVAQFANGKASVGLRVVDKEHPFYSLTGGDNMVAFTTNRYQTNPLVIRGPGAGAEVTAAGVFADIVRASALG